jgi:hypothetical protein
MRGGGACCSVPGIAASARWTCDREVLSWLTGEALVPPEHDTELFRRLRGFHQHASGVR